MAIVFGLENPKFLLAKSDIFIPKCNRRGGGTGLRIIPKDTNFFSASLIIINHHMINNQYHINKHHHQVYLAR